MSSSRIAILMVVTEHIQMLLYMIDNEILKKLIKERKKTQYRMEHFHTKRKILKKWLLEEKNKDKNF